MKTLGQLIEDCQSVTTDLELAYKNFQVLRELGTQDAKYQEMQRVLAVKENHLQGLVDRINNMACIEGMRARP